MSDDKPPCRACGQVPDGQSWRCTPRELAVLRRWREHPGTTAVVSYVDDGDFSALRLGAEAIRRVLGVDVDPVRVAHGALRLALEILADATQAHALLVERPEADEGERAEWEQIREGALGVLGRMIEEGER